MQDKPIRDFHQAEPWAVNVKQCGARGDGTADDSQAIQQAMERGPGLVVIPPGVYVIGRTLRIGSDTRLLVHPQATLMLAAGAGKTSEDFLLTNRDHKQGNANIEISGGIWCGNNVNNPRSSKLIDPGTYSGVMINFYNVRGLTFSDAMLCDSQSYYVRLSRVTRFLVEDIRFHSKNPSNNNDGIHLGGHCEDGTVRRLRGLGRGAPADDMVAMNADDALQRTECDGGACGPIRNIRVYDIEADDCHSFVRLLSVESPIENIDVDDVRGGCRVSMLNMDGCRACRVQVFDPNDPRYARGIGVVRNVRISGVNVFKSAANTAPLIDLQERVDNLTLQHFERDHRRDASPGAPTLLAANLPDQAIHLEGLNEQQAEWLETDSFASLRIGPAASGDARLGLFSHADLRWGQRLSLREGGFGRLLVAAGKDSMPSP